MKKVIALTLMVAGLALPGMASTAGAATFASHFFAPAIKYNGIYAKPRPRLITVPQPQGYTVRYAIGYYTAYSHLSATAVGRNYVNGRSFAVKLTFTSPRRINLKDGRVWWVFTRLTVSNYHASYPDTGYAAFFKGL